MVDRLTTMGQAIFGSNVTVSEATIAASTIHIHLDMTNQQVGYSLQLTLASAYRAFTESLLASCNIGEHDSDFFYMSLVTFSSVFKYTAVMENVMIVKRLDQGHLHPKLEDPRLTCPREAGIKPGPPR